MYRKVLLSLVFVVALFLMVPTSFIFASIVPSASTSSLVATTPGSDVAPADGTTTASMTLTFKTSGGTPLAGDTASLSIPSNGTAVISPLTAILDASGSAVFTITSRQGGTYSIDATDVGPNATLTALGTVTFTSVLGTTTSTVDNSTATASCPQSAPLNAPNLYQVNAQNSQATLFFAPPNDTFDAYTISYGLSASADNYSVTFPMGMTTGAVSYKINSLTPKTAYFFKVRANNGCAAGPWSSVKESNAPLSKLPATGPSPALMSVGLTGAALFLAGMFFLVF